MIRSPSIETLPVLTLRAAFTKAHDEGPIVLSAATGSGKSTEVPRWCKGPVLVVEPRRIACRSLAARVAEMERSRLGDDVGYVVRDEHVAGAHTRIVFATPGIVLRNPALLRGASTLVLDEFHERSLELDLLLALAVREGRTGLVVMSATLEGERLARHVGATYLVGEGRSFPVDVRYLGSPDGLPDATDLPARVHRALEAAAGDPGDVLVFLPGKAEIDACLAALGDDARTLVPLHGGLTMNEQHRAFEPCPRRKVILATNVAETSLTIPGIGVVVDSGLVRQTRYHDGRASLALVPIAEDSAAQRAGRAGRTAPGVCYRLWRASARLSPVTPAALHRESLVPLVLGAAAWGTRPEDLPLFDAPKPYALAAARADLAAWRALDARGALTTSGAKLYAMPVEPRLGRLLAEAEREGCLDDAIDLVAMLAVGRPPFLPGAPPEHAEDDLRRAGCDLTAMVRAVRIGQPAVHRLSPFVLDEARATRKRLRREHGLDPSAPKDAPFDRDALVRAAITADPRCVHVARQRGRELAFGNGGTELELARESGVRHVKDVEALVVLESRAFGEGRDVRLLVTCGTAIPLAWIGRFGLGERRLGAVRVEGGRALATVEQVYAGRVVASREESPRGALAREAIAELFRRGSIFREALATTRERLAMASLAEQLAQRAHPLAPSLDARSVAPGPKDLDAWIHARLEALGVESGDDLALLSAVDLTAPDVPFEVRSQLERELPLRVTVGDATYDAEYDLAKGQVMLRMIRGSRRDPPPLGYLPRFPGLRICVDGPRGIAVLRERG